MKNRQLYNTIFISKIKCILKKAFNGIGMKLFD